MSFTVSLPQSLFDLPDEIERQVREQVEDVLIDFADDLQRKSPRGVSASGDSLAGQWDVEPGRGKSLGVVRNDAERAYNRIVGRGPGKFTPWGDGTDLNDWVEGKLGISDPRQRRGIAYVIAKRHAAQGSRRYQSGDNILGIDPQSKDYRPDSPVYDTVREIERRTNIRVTI